MNSVFILFCGSYDPYVEDVFASVDNAKKHMNDLRKLLGINPLTWKENNYSDGTKQWETNLDGTVYRIAEFQVK